MEKKASRNASVSVCECDVDVDMYVDMSVGGIRCECEGAPTCTR